MKIYLEDTRIAFANLFEAKPMANDPKSKPTYSASFLFPATHPAFKIAQDAVLAVAQEKWPTTYKAVLAGLKAQDKLALHDGNIKANYQGFPGNFYVAASRQEVKGAPDVRGRDGVTRLTAKDGVIYSGCYVLGVVEIWAQDNQYGKRVNAELVGVQYLRKGDAFSAGAVAADSDFKALAPEEEDTPAGTADWSFEGSDDLVGA